MPWRYGYTPDIWPMLASGAFMLVLGIYALRRRSVPGALPFAIVMLIATVWALAAALELAALDRPAKIFWYSFVTGFCMMPMAVARLAFVVAFAGYSHLLTRRNLLLLSIPALVVFILVATDSLHHWMVSEYQIDRAVRAVNGAGGWIAMAFAYLLLLVILVILAVRFVVSPGQRWQLALIITAMLFSHTVFLIDTFGSNPFHPLDLVVLAMNIAFVLYALALFRFHMLDPISASRQQVIEQMREGMLVADAHGRLVDLNPVAAAILNQPAARLRGQALNELLPAAGAPGQTQAEITLGSGEAARRYQLSISPLWDRRRILLGRLLLLHDVTEQQRAQAQLVEQQRALAALQERERLARELHDNTGQVLGYVSTQAQAIRKWLQDGEIAQAEAQLTRLAHVAQEAHLDLRDSILSLKSGGLENWNFLAALRQHLAAFQETYAVRIELSLPPELEAAAFKPAPSVQLLRVLQEALTNARRRGKAGCMRIHFERAGSLLRISVLDDGCGFDPQQVRSENGKHFGLAFMCERMAQIGGDLQIESQQGAGARLLLSAPLANLLEDST